MWVQARHCLQAKKKSGKNTLNHFGCIWPIYVVDKSQQAAGLAHLLQRVSCHKVELTLLPWFRFESKNGAVDLTLRHTSTLRSARA